MRKEKFLYEIIDNYLYIISLGCMVIENYSLVDSTQDYINGANVLDDFLDFYDQLYENINSDNYSEAEIDTILNHLVQNLKQKTIFKINKSINDRITKYVPNSEEFIEENLHHNKKGKRQDLTEETLIDFMQQLRIAEAEKFST